MKCNINNRHKEQDVKKVVKLSVLYCKLQIDHFTVVCSVTWPLSGSEAGVDLILIQTLLLLSCKCT